MVHYNYTISIATIMVSKNYPIIGVHVAVNVGEQKVTITTI